MFAWAFLITAALLWTGQVSDGPISARMVREGFTEMFTGDSKSPYAWINLDTAAMKVWQGLGIHAASHLNNTAQRSAGVLESDLRSLLDNSKPSQIYGTQVRVFGPSENDLPAYVVFARFELAAISARSGLILCVRDSKSGRFEVREVLQVLADRELSAMEVRYGAGLRLLLSGVLRGSSRGNLDLEFYEVRPQRLNLLWERKELPRGQVRVFDQAVEVRWLRKPTYPFEYTVERFAQTRRGLRLIETKKEIEP